MGPLGGPLSKAHQKIGLVCSLGAVSGSNTGQILEAPFWAETAATHNLSGRGNVVSYIS